MKDIYGFDHGRDAYGFEKNSAVTDDQISAVPILPFGSSYVGYQRGALTGNGGEGLLRGFAGGTVGSTVGGALGSVAGLPGALVGGMAGNLLGTHYATRGMIPSVQQNGLSSVPQASAQPLPEQPPKTASYDVYGFATKEALAAPGLLGQMSSAVSRMGKATSIAAQRAGNAFQAERGMSKLTGGQLPNSGLGRSLVSAGQAGVDSLMKSQAGRRVIGTGVGLGAAGTLAAGNAAYNATQPKPPVALPR